MVEKALSSEGGAETSIQMALLAAFEDESFIAATEALQKLSGGVSQDRVDVSSLQAITVTMDTNAETQDVSACPTHAVHMAVAAAFGRPVKKVEEVLMGGDVVQPSVSFEQCGIEASLVIVVPP